MSHQISYSTRNASRINTGRSVRWRFAMCGALIFPQLSHSHLPPHETLCFKAIHSPMPFGKLAEESSICSKFKSCDLKSVIPARKCVTDLPIDPHHGTWPLSHLTSLVTVLPSTHYSPSSMTLWQLESSHLTNWVWWREQRHDDGTGKVDVMMGGRWAWGTLNDGGHSPCQSCIPSLILLNANYYGCSAHPLTLFRQLT